MTWVRLDEKFTEHPKVVGLSDGAFRAYVTALCYCNRNLTDGMVPAGFVRMIFGPQRRVTELVTAGLIDRGIAGALLVHDFSVYQPSRAEIQKQRSEARDRMSKLRGGSQPVRANIAGSSPASVSESVTDPLSVTPLPPEQSKLLERLHEQVRVRVFGGMNAPDTGWCDDLVRRGMTESDIRAACDASVGKGRGALNYCRAVLLRRVEEREAGRDPDAQRGAGDRAARGDGDARPTQRGGFRAVGAGRGAGQRVEGFDSTGLHAIGDDDDVPNAGDEGGSASPAAPIPLRSV